MSELENMNEKREGKRKMNRRKILLPVTTRHVEACAYRYCTTNTKHMSMMFVHTQGASSSYYSARILPICVKKNQLDAQLILSTFRQPLHDLSAESPRSITPKVLTEKILRVGRNLK
jgi:transcriptional regulator NrdR family protein